MNTEPTKKTDLNMEAVQEFINRYATLNLGDDDEAYLDAYLQAHAEITADEAAVRAKAKSLRDLNDSAEIGLLGDLRRRRSGLEWNHKEPIRQLVAEKIAGKKARHVKTAHGKIGFRTTAARQTLNVFDESGLEGKHPRFFILQPPKLDKKALTEALKAGEDFKKLAWLDEVPATEKLYMEAAKPPKEQKGTEQ